MSFEFDENRLANPPLKSDQEAITSFWGIYRWPYKKYNRYAQLEGLEQTADETRTMAKALRYITTANELGLSIDGGLGWLAGPDTNSRVVDKGEKPAVFGESRFVPEPKQKFARVGKTSRSSDPTSAYSQSYSTLHTAFERMLGEAGYQGDTLDASVRLMMETEDTSGVPVEANPASNNLFSSPTSIEGLRRAIRTPGSLGNGVGASTAGDLNPFTQAIADEEDVQVINIQSNPVARSSNVESKAINYPLRPNDLTNAQKEMLLEIEWAQRAFMQSYAIAIIDNPSTFKNIKALTIARLPSRHLPTLRREDFWQSLAQVEKLSLGIIPDWREISKLPTSWVQDSKVQPSLAVSTAYQVLQEQISRRQNIKTLHFEWLCGGEYAPGMFSRNQNILAAPLVPKALSMVSRTQQAPVLALPYVEHLSLKNCWVSPHILGRFLAGMRASLQSFKFDSVSLSAPIPLHADPGPAHPPNHGVAMQNAGAAQAMQAAALNWQQHNAQAQVAPPVAQPIQVGVWMHGAMLAQPFHPPQNQQNQQFQPPPPPAPAVNNDPEPVGLEWLEVRSGCWSQLIDALTPGKNLADIRYDRNVGPKPPSRVPTKLKKMEFRSCGYVRMPLDFDQAMLDSPDAPGLPLQGKKGTDYESIMMKSFDHSLATIINHISAMEAATLGNAWNIETGWTSLQADLVNESKLDGILNPGRGRFDGFIEATNLTSSGTLR
jgi:hypothetical protein